MREYVILIAMMLGLPGVYWILMQWQKPHFEEEKNQNRKFLKSLPEGIVVVVSELALIMIWDDYTKTEISGIMFVLLYTVLVVMTVLCMTDFWEKIVPNRILGIMILTCFIEVGLQALWNVSQVLRLVPSMIIGLSFCVISFGLSYMISYGSLGSGDVKLAILLGIFLTSEYVVGTIFYGCVISALYSIVQLCRKKLTRKDVLPFVPFLYIGLIITYLVG